MRERETFAWAETAERLRALIAATPLRPDASGHAFIGAGVRFVPPAVLPVDGREPARYLAELPERLGTHLVVLLQAGAAALGLWHGDELTRHKVIKKYVVRGHGSAQATHLKTKGKSRYGSRLRLRNARALLDELNTRAGEWLEDAPAEVFYSCPVRLWADVFGATVRPPFTRDSARRLRFHVHTPGFDELLRVRRRMLRGAIEPLDETAGGP